MKNAKKYFIVLFFIVLSIMGVAQNVRASGFKTESGDSVTISESVDGALITSGENIIIEGDVNGVLFAAGNNITIKGDINGPVFLAANNINIEGNIEGEIFATGNIIRIDDTAELSRDAFIAGNQIIIDGAVGRDIFSGGNSIQITNEVGRNAYIGTENLTFNDNGLINGDLIYQANNKVANVEQYVEGEVDYHATNKQVVNEERTIWSKVIRAIGSILSAIIIWLFLSKVTNNRWFTISPEFIRQPILLTFIGLGIFFLIPTLILLSFFSRVFIHLGVLMLYIFLLLLFFGKIIVAAAIGRYLIEPRLSANHYKGLVGFTLAYTILYLASIIPWIGWMISLLCLFYTVGLVFREIVFRLRSQPVI